MSVAHFQPGREIAPSSSAPNQTKYQYGLDVQAHIHHHRKWHPIGQGTGT